MIRKRYTILTVMLCIMSMVLLCFGLAACGDKTVKVTTSYDPTQGTVTIAPESEDGTYKKDTEITVTVTPNEGYALDTFKLSTEDENKTLDDEGKFVFKVQEDTTITVTFKSTVVPVESVTLDEDTLELEVGGRTEDASATLVATVHPDNATDKTVMWTSSDPTIATVEGGNVTALAVGETTITATAGGKSATCTVTVTQHAHVFGAWVDEVPATCVKAGTKGYKECSSCEKKFDNTDKEITELEIPIDASAHHLVDQVGEDGHWQECDNEGCDYKSAVTGHVFNGALVDKGETGHANKCSIGDCTYTGSVTVHSAKDTTYTREADKHYQLCECGAHVNEATHAAAEGAQWQKDPDNNQHYKECVCGQRVEVATHAAKDNVWQHDEQNTTHFKLCVCGEHVEEDAHFASGYEYDTGDMTTGQHYKLCEGCGQKFDIGNHQKSAKPQGGTNGHHYTCTICSFAGADENHTQPADGVWHEDTAASGKHQHYYICSECDMKVSEIGSTHYEYDSADGEFLVCSKCNYRSKLRDHKLNFVPDQDGTHHHGECTNQLCTYKSESTACKDSNQVQWTANAGDPTLGHTGKCACGNEFSLESHDGLGDDGRCSKCGYLNKVHTHADNPDEHGFYDGICDICGEQLDTPLWTVDATGKITAFSGNAQYTQVRVPGTIGSVKITSVKFTNVNVQSVIVPQGVDVPVSAFANCTGLKSVVILNDQLAEIKALTFNGCTALESVVLPASVQTLNKNMFGSSPKITKINIYFLGTNAAWNTMVNKLAANDAARKLIEAADSSVLFYSSESTQGGWHWKNGAEGVIPEKWD